MLRIAICDDEAEQRALVSDMLRLYLERRPGLMAKTQTFSSGCELLAAVEGEDDFDLYILDIIMPDLSGIDVGVKLREQEREGAIVYLTSAPEYAVDSYQTQASCYLLKPVRQERFEQAVDQALVMARQRKTACALVKTKSGWRRLPLDYILYVELTGRVLHYHLSSGEEVESMTLRTSFQEAVGPLLADSRFFLCGSSFAVNLYYVSAVEKKYFVLEGGIQVPIPRGRAPEARVRWSAYWSGSSH